MDALELEAMQIVSDINEKINNAAMQANVLKDVDIEDALLQCKATFISDGEYCAIEFLGIDIWNSAEDGRGYVHEDTVDEALEPLVHYVNGKISKYVLAIHTLLISRML